MLRVILQQVKLHGNKTRENFKEKIVFCIHLLIRNPVKKAFFVRARETVKIESFDVKVFKNAILLKHGKFDVYLSSSSLFFTNIFFLY